MDLMTAETAVMKNTNAAFTEVRSNVPMVDAYIGIGYAMVMMIVVIISMSETVIVNYIRRASSYVGMVSV